LGPSCASTHARNKAVEKAAKEMGGDFVTLAEQVKLDTRGANSLEQV
jgi:hypothetical protein